MHPPSPRCLGEGISREALKATVARLYKPKGWKQPDISVPYPSEMPSQAICLQLAEAAYDATPPTEIGEYHLLKSTPTLKFYRRGGHPRPPPTSSGMRETSPLIIAVRGTADAKDLRADFNVAFNRVDQSARYIADLKMIKEILQQEGNPPAYGVGHSLGGAIIDALIKAGYLKAGVSFNPAIEKSELQSHKNYRIYKANDPLFNAMGQYAKIGALQKQPELHTNDAIAAVQALKAHTLTGGDFKSFIRGAFGLDPTNQEQLEKLRETDLLEPSTFDVKKNYEEEKKRRRSIAGRGHSAKGSLIGGFPFMALASIAQPLYKGIIKGIEGDQSLRADQIEYERQQQQAKRKAKEQAEAAAYREQEEKKEKAEKAAEKEELKKKIAAEKNPTKLLFLRAKLDRV